MTVPVTIDGDAHVLMATDLAAVPVFSDWVTSIDHQRQTVIDPLEDLM